MIVIYLLFFFRVACASKNLTSDVLKVVKARTGLNAQKCLIYDVVENNCMRCVCDKDGAYYCNDKPCNDDQDHKVLLGDPTRATCNPLMVYQNNRTTCVCDSDGYWPHDRCERFRTLKSKTWQTKPSDLCEPNSYVIRDCNVCKCGANGVIDRCTKNVCKNGKSGRRTISGIHGSCQPSSWYSLAPCQFCFCVHANKLVCSTGNTQNEKLELGAYNLTVCGLDLIKQVVELIPDGLKALRDGDITTKNPTTTTTTKPQPKSTPITFYRTTVQSSSRPYDSEPYIVDNFQIQLTETKSEPNNVAVSESPKPSEIVEYESSEENNITTVAEAQVARENPMREISLSTLLPYDDDEEENANESNEVDDDNGNMSRLPGVTFDPMYSLQVQGSPVGDNGLAGSMSLSVMEPPPMQPLQMSQPQQQLLQQQSMQQQPLSQQLLQEQTMQQQPMQQQPLQQQPQQPPNLMLFAPPATTIPPPANPVPLLVMTHATPTQDPNVVKIHLPSVLDKLIQMALRKSMVKINSKTKCVPGETSQDNCNYCYCLTNGKMLCTDKKC